jgi:hypothetical protein
LGCLFPESFLCTQEESIVPVVPKPLLPHRSWSPSTSSWKQWIGKVRWK